MKAQLYSHIIIDRLPAAMSGITHEFVINAIGPSIYNMIYKRT